MKLYRHFLFPWLVDRLMRCETLTELRQELVSSARGRLLEIGCGSGLNLPHIPAGPNPIICSDPNPGMLNLTIKTVRMQGRMPVQVVGCSAEDLPFQASVFDTVLSTWTLCSIPKVSEALQEVRRVLRPGGLFLFVEHGESPEIGIATWQRRLTPLQKRLADGCHLDRNIEQLIVDSGFRIRSLRKEYIEGAPRLLGYTYLGVANPKKLPLHGFPIHVDGPGESGSPKEGHRQKSHHP